MRSFLLCAESFSDIKWWATWSRFVIAMVVVASSVSICVVDVFARWTVLCMDDLLVWLTSFVLTQKSTRKPGRPVDQARTVAPQNQGVPVNLTCKLTRKHRETVKFREDRLDFRIPLALRIGCLADKVETENHRKLPIRWDRSANEHRYSDKAKFKLWMCNLNWA